MSDDNSNKDKKRKFSLGVGLDVGTMNLVSARKYASGIETKRIRDAFLDLPPTSKKMLKLSGVS